MTNSFKEKIGEAEYDTVYKGKLHNGIHVAVKVFDESNSIHDTGVVFMNEVTTVSRTSHVNVVALLGFCSEGRRKALIYEFMPNGSLEKYIFKDNHLLGWEALFQISLGVAQGLEYLHRCCNIRILHFGIKPHSILLDEDFSPKIAGFAHARVCTTKESITSTSGARGTIGYIAPELFWRSFGGVSHKSDVYSYGMTVLQMVGLGGRKILNATADCSSEIYFPESMYERHFELDEDLGLTRITNEEDNEKVRKMVMTGLWCVQTHPSNRPTMSRVIEMLEGSLDSLQVPPKPLWYSPLRSQTGSSNHVTTSNGASDED
ncbi:rust resistance kinase Lr10 [Ziziphus jujuba]|uniref:Rust resistance kinase Lr10 n=1 Tax=Ziziphus jujuba TaxID=326968 RepID=A0ABM3I0B8_ZIZJJ|nr:rust resistance kinase Lr10 [Ziziphus jujuba]